MTRANKPTEPSAQTALAGFPPIASTGATTLILGSMPGVASLHAVRYYAHPRNAFWPVMSAIYQHNIQHYDDGIALLFEHNLALWDVLASCERSGSLDANIKPDTVRANDFHAFLHRHTLISRIVFNGTAAAKLFKRHVVLPADRVFLLKQAPSTSPAMASLTVAQKTERWRQCLWD